MADSVAELVERGKAISPEDRPKRRRGVAHIAEKPGLCLRER
jgi:hypothetical protein